VCRLQERAGAIGSSATAATRAAQRHHGWPVSGYVHHTVAKTNADYWADKVMQNRRCDLETDRLLADAGWLVLRVWEHEAPADAALHVSALVREQAVQRV
jgi:G:T-mismatch repair DNA endonuclease (very short patch repair protein)